MTIVFLTIFGIGLLAALIGGIQVLVAAFRCSVLWGIAYIFVPFASLIFLFVHWAEAKRGFIVQMIGLAMMVTVTLAPQELRESFLADLQAKIKGTSSPSPAPDLTAQIATQREQIERMEKQFGATSAELMQRYQALAATRRALKPGDTEATTRYNAEAATYQQQTAALRQSQEEINTARKSLDTLLAERSRKAATNGGAVGGSGKQVIMYSTAQCPACQQAKQYFAQRGVAYEERNVQNSPAAAAEFQKLGGRGVPLILVGDQRMEGFSPQALDRML